MNDNEFIEICKKSSSMSEAAKIVNIPFTSFIRKAKSLGCYSPNQGWSKGRVSITDDRILSKYNFEDIFCQNSLVSRERAKTLLIKLSILEYKCGICEIYPIWNNKSLSLHIDHINGIRNDHRIENLRFLCPNCHSQTETYCNFNKNSKKISSFQFEEIEEAIKSSNTITSVIRKLGILDTKVNRVKILKMIDQHSFKLMDSNEDDLPIGVSKKISKYSNCERCFKPKVKNKCRICPQCSSISQRKSPRPSLDILLNEVQELGYCATGRKYGVTDNAIRKWIKSYQKVI